MEISKMKKQSDEDAKTKFFNFNYYLAIKCAFHVNM